MEEKLEEQEPGRRHLSGFYVQRGKDVMAGGRRRNTIMLATEIIKSASNIRNTRFVSGAAPASPRSALCACGLIVARWASWCWNPALPPASAHTHALGRAVLPALPTIACARAALRCPACPFAAAAHPEAQPRQLPQQDAAGDG